MLYSEFLKGTRAPETPDTYDQFQIIGQIYEDCEGMTKEEAYRIWKQRPTAANLNAVNFASGNAWNF